MYTLIFFYEKIFYLRTEDKTENNTKYLLFSSDEGPSASLIKLSVLDGFNLETLLVS